MKVNNNSVMLVQFNNGEPDDDFKNKLYQHFKHTFEPLGFLLVVLMFDFNESDQSTKFFSIKEQDVEQLNLRDDIKKDLKDVFNLANKVQVNDTDEHGSETPTIKVKKEYKK
jgi:hypothetical protein